MQTYLHYLKIARTGLIVLGLTAAITACGGGDKDHEDHDRKDRNHSDKAADAGHHHEAPHGGALVELGEHFAHVEIKIYNDADQKKIVLYVLSAHADKAVRLGQKEVLIDVLTARRTDNLPPQEFTVILKAVANPNTGEEVGNTSQFEAPLNDLLLGLTEFEFNGRIRHLTFPGDRNFKHVPFNYPKGNVAD